MSKVLRLAKTSNKQTIDALTDLLGRALQGGVTGILLCFRMPDGTEDCYFTGPYKEVGQVMNAATRIKVQLAQLQRDIM